MKVQGVSRFDGGIKLKWGVNHLTFVHPMFKLIELCLQIDFLIAQCDLIVKKLGQLDDEIVE
jgi:hypothetical protein